MTRGKTVLLAGGLVVVAAVAVCAGGGWWWLQAHKDELRRAGHDAFVDGAHYGAGKDTNACVAEAERRLATAGGIVGEATNKVFLEGCLKGARLAPGFCDGVPRRAAMGDSVAWLRTRCASLPEAQQMPCTRLLGAVQERCESP